MTLRLLRRIASIVFNLVAMAILVLAIPLARWWSKRRERNSYDD